MWSYNHIDELYHYGVKGMKWGVIRSNHINKKIDRLTRKNEKIDSKLTKLDKKAAKSRYKSVKKGGLGLLPTRKSAKLEYKSAKLEDKAHKLDDHTSKKYVKTKRKAAKLKLKSFKKMNASETTRRDFKRHVKAAKARYKLENNNARIYSLDQRLITIGKNMVEDD